MLRAALPRALAVACFVVVTSAAGSARAGDTSTAEHLFEEGLGAMKKQDYKAACDAFAGSNEADPSPGTQINLALCNERQGKLASAWGWYRTAAGLAEQRGQKERADLARAEAAKLEPKLHKLVIAIKPPLPEGLTVTRDGATVPSAVIGKEVPVDPGEHTIEVSAKGKQPFRQKVVVPAGPGVDRLEVPALADAKDDKPATTVAPAPLVTEPPPAGGGRDGSTQRTIGFIAGGAGLAAGVVAGILGVLTIAEENEREDQQQNAQRAEVERANAVAAGRPNQAAQRAIERDEYQRSADSHRDAAKGNQTGAIIAGVGGGLLLAGGIVLVLTAPSGSRSGRLDKPTILPLVGGGTYGLGLGGSF